MSKNHKFILIFSLAYFFVVIMLFLLQISEIPWFFVWLVLMHGGIAILAVSKRKFKDLGVKQYYKRAYLSFLLFIPILIYKIIVAITSLEENEVVITYISLGLIIICIVIGIGNIYSYLNSKKN